MGQKYADSEYLETQFFEDRDLEIRGAVRAIVTTRSVHRCSYADVLQKPHEIPSGTRALTEWAVVEGVPGRWWACLSCLDEWLDEIRSDQ